MKPKLLSSALWYAQQGHLVFPLTPGSKVPLKGSSGFKDASMDPATIRAWWAKDPTYNIGLSTGHLFDVIDIDGQAGWDTYETLTGLPAMIGLVETPRGAHRYIHPTGDGCATAFAPGLDYRGIGGYVVAPPSIVNGVQYTWAIGLSS